MISPLKKKNNDIESFEFSSGTLHCIYRGRCSNLEHSIYLYLKGEFLVNRLLNI